MYATFSMERNSSAPSADYFTSLPAVSIDELSKASAYISGTNCSTLSSCIIAAINGLNPVLNNTPINYNSEANTYVPGSSLVSSLLSVPDTEFQYIDDLIAQKAEYPSFITVLASISTFICFRPDLLPSLAPYDSFNIFKPSSDELALWGSKEEANYFETNVREKTNDCDAVNLTGNSQFKAASNNNREIESRFDENGIFALACGRHGVLDRLYDIYFGEGKKYMLSGIEHMLTDPKKNINKPFSIMYDIVCLRQKVLEKQFPVQLSRDTKYAVSVFYAYAHNMVYQSIYYPSYIFGFTDGEGCERFWSFLNGYAYIFIFLCLF